MNPEEFLHTTEDLLYKEIAKNTNILFGKHKTAALSTGLFLKLPIEVTISKVEEPLPPIRKELATLMPYFSAYVKMGNTTTVHFTFLYHNEKDLLAISRNLHRRSMFFTFVYMHELQHILRKHITSSYAMMMQRILGEHPNAHHVINIAQDYAINYSLKDIFVAAATTNRASGGQLPIMQLWQEIQEIGLYNKRYHDEQLSDIDILKELRDTPPEITATPLSDLFDSVSIGGTTSVQPSEKSTKDDIVSSDKCSTAGDDLDNSITDLAAALEDLIKSNTRGTATGELFNNLFEAVKVDTGWFKRIKASFKRQVFYKTHNYSTSWSNLNNTYRHIYKSPKKTFIDDKVSIILSIDHSGSMSTVDLQRLLYLIESEATRIAQITVLIHDTRVIKEFNISNEYDLTKSPEFTQALATRYTSGGTSHECIFRHIEDMKIKDTSQILYLSFSDNCSDIEQVFGKYPIMRKLTNYWLCTTNNPVNVIGTNITMV